MGQCFFAFDPVDIYVVNCYNATSNEHNHDEFALALQTITGFTLFFVICLFLFCHRYVTILEELELLISVYSLSTAYQKEKKKVTIYKTLLGVSYLKTRNSTCNKLLTGTYLQTLFSIYDQQLLFFYKEKLCLTYVRVYYSHERKKEKTEKVIQN